MPTKPHATGLLALILWSAIALHGIPAYADSIRCGRHVISLGDTVEELSRECGEPIKRQSVQETIQIDGSFMKARLELWHYQLDERRLSREVLVYKGEVVGVRMGSR